ncbi:MAG: hypothetical protein A7316_00430 [Candidatus Altiarchaeales archaeon WOR_SM1_86-2]|nr:MAG: hypothetical protein A7315_14225 [Candidatus Altiarchaeales archaeon WOR_SM1_79]ODS38199.1 MAG: hypothetical protein A7316_00430 [Candidatus Altiarchaeales archaeon WOR_SM1_86-2]
MNILEDYFEHVKIHRGENTYKTKKYSLQPFEDWLKSNKKSLKDCTDDDIALYLKKKKEKKKLLNRTLKQYLREIKTMFRWYEKRKRVDMPTDVSDFPKYLKEINRCELIAQMQIPSFMIGPDPEKLPSLTFEDFQKLIKVAEYHDRIIIYLLAYFGMRVREFINSLNESNIDWQKGEVKVVGTKTKASPRTLYFDKQYTGKIIDIYLKNRATYKKKYRHQINKRLDRYKDPIDTKNNPHAFRRLFNTEMFKSLNQKHKDPMDRYIVKRFMGHEKEKDPTELYSNLPDLKNIWLKYHYLNDYHNLIQLP